VNRRWHYGAQCTHGILNTGLDVTDGSGSIDIVRVHIRVEVGLVDLGRPDGESVVDVGVGSRGQGPLVVTVTSPRPNVLRSQQEAISKTYTFEGARDVDSLRW
jgi:hypothetical protein